MHVLIITQYFHPEVGAPIARFMDLGRHLVARGHRVTISTGVPNFPSGIVPPDYRGLIYRRETIEGMEVVRTWMYASPAKTPRTKAVGALAFAATASTAAVLAAPRADVVVATAPPPTVGFVGLVAAARLGRPLVYDLRDLWPDVLVDDGRLRNPVAVGILEGLNAELYRRAAAIVTVAHGKRERLVELGAPRERIHVIPNGVDIALFDAWAEAHRREVGSMLREHGVPADAPLFVYAGLMNPAQGLDVVLRAAELLARNPSLRPLPHFALAGEGSERERLVDAAMGRGLAHVHFLPMIPRTRVPALLRHATATLVPLAPRGDRHTVPSKLFEAMAAARPVVLSAEGEAADILAAARGGVVAEPGDAASLARAIHRLLDSGDAAAEMGRRAREYVEAHYDRAELNRRFEAVLFDAARFRR